MKANVSGQAYALTVLTPILAGQEAPLRAYLEGLDRGDSPLARLGRTHFARWVIVPDLVYDPAEPWVDHLHHAGLVFTSNFDGPLDSYLDELCDELAPEAPEIWGRCAGSPPRAAGPDLKAYLLRNQVHTGFFVAAYPQATVSKVRQSLEQRRRMIDFAVRAQTMAPDELRRTFGAEFGR